MLVEKVRKRIWRERMVGVRQWQIAKRIGVPANTLSQIMGGHHFSKDRSKVLRRVALALGINVNVLMKNGSKKKRPPR